ncbi:MAG: hypothetical protein JWR61_1327 [Ferruginibacter sp.]|uniref:hypothetical protein n=1 Tax=Ferruginibacter sp. TaxID=1940288 RepID=UPI00265B3DF7|nr:hypothetical protein [Ferruginibacter sp.]MDB5276372.1 hypothetical protein [Ferruginibacter sp.]
MENIEAGDFVLHQKQRHMNHGIAFVVLEIHEKAALCEYFDADLVLTQSLFALADLIPHRKIAYRNSD